MNRKSVLLLLATLSIVACKETPAGKKVLKQEILQAEKAFEKMAAESGIAIAFRHFADSSAVIIRERDTLIRGPQAIFNYYNNPKMRSARVTWSPDFVDVSEDGTLGYTYGNYVWKTTDSSGVNREFKGVFHTVWKKQKDGTWRYVWD